MNSIDYDNLSQYETWQLVLWIGLNLQFQHTVIPLSTPSQDDRNKLEETYNSLLYPLLDEVERRGLKKDDVVSATLHALNIRPSTSDDAAQS
jgi:hypothetical protein